MTPPSRRRLLAASGLSAVGAFLSGCGGGEQDAAPDPGSALRWWDQYAPQQKMESELFARFARSPDGVRVDYTTYDPTEMGQALQLARTSDQLPDVFTLAVDRPPSTLVDQGWFTPLNPSAETLRHLPPDSLFPQVSVFDDTIYSLPIRTARQYDSLTWFNRPLLERSDVDPETDLATWDGFRSAAAAVTRAGGTGVFGWVAPLQFPDRLAAHMLELAMAAGVRGVPDQGGLFDPRTGEYVNDSDAMVEAVEFLLSMKRDRTLYPASSLLNARSARARWATGVVGMFLDGSYSIGVLRTSFDEFTPKVGVTSVPVAEPGTRPQIAKPPTGGGQAFWISAKSRFAAQARTLIAKFATPTVQRQMAEAMDAMPLDLGAVADSDAHPTYKRAARLFARQVVLAPSPDVRNPDVAKVRATMPTITPGLGEIAQGLFSDQLSDVRRALRRFNDELTRSRDRAIAKARKDGARVGVEDWVFDDWVQGTDYDNGATR